MAPETVDETITLTQALEVLRETGPVRRPYGYRVESACNAATADVIALYGVELGSTSEAIRDLIARGAASLASDRA